MFWRLVSDSAVIVQQVCSVAIFVCCFVGISQERIRPAAIIIGGSLGTLIGWVIWDYWITKEEEAAKERATADAAAAAAVVGSGGSNPEPEDVNGADSRSTTNSDGQSPLDSFDSGFSDEFHPPPQIYGDPLSNLSPRNQQRVVTLKSAALIYCAVLGMSPILKSLTKSTTSDSIWAMSCWLMGINLFFFDYGGVVGAK
jgi:phosphatidylinositol N-acetylglucosaminyltransferase subunit C